VQSIEIRPIRFIGNNVLYQSLDSYSSKAARAVKKFVILFKHYVFRIKMIAAVLFSCSIDSIAYL
jgi:hypothetical protein